MRRDPTQYLPTTRAKKAFPDDEKYCNMNSRSNRTDSNDLFDVWPCGSCMFDGEEWLCLLMITRLDHECNHAHLIVVDMDMGVD